MNHIITFFVGISAFFSGLFGYHVVPTPVQKAQETVVVVASSSIVMATTSLGVSVASSSSADTDKPPKSETQASSTFLYKNEKYWFTLTFPNAWAGYRAVEYVEKNSEGGVLFGIKDQDEIFYITVWTKEEWKAENDDLGDAIDLVGTKITENKKYVFTSGSSQDFRYDVVKLADMRRSILGTFSLLEK